MALTQALKGRVDEAVARIHGHFGETVYVRRLIPSDQDPVYNEDLTRVESEFRLLGIVNLDVPRRTLDRFSLGTPIDMMVTFAKDVIDDSGLSYINIGDVIVWRGKRHSVVQINEVPKAVIEDLDDTNDVLSEYVELAVFAVISAVPENPVVPVVPPNDPTAGNIILNPDFEGGQVGWNFSPTSDVTTTKANTGVRSYHQIPTAQNQFTDQDLTGKLTPGKTYTLDSEAFAVNGVPTVKVKVGDDEFKVAGDPSWIGDGTWHRMPTLTFTAPTDPATPVTLSIGQGDSTAPGEFYLDTAMLDAPPVPVDPNTPPAPTPDPDSPPVTGQIELQRAEALVGQYALHLLFNKDVSVVGTPALPLRVTVNHDLAYYGGIVQDSPRRFTVMIDRLLEPTDEVLVYYTSLGNAPPANAIVLASDHAKEIQNFAGVKAVMV